MRLRTIARAATIAICALALLAATPDTRLCLSKDDVVQQVAAGTFTWKSGAPAGWAGNHYMVTWSDFTANVTNNGNCYDSARPGRLMSYGDMVGCTAHPLAQQNMAVSGNYHTIYYAGRYNATTQSWICGSPLGSDGYTGTPITLPAGTVAPTSSGTQLALTLSSITYPGSTSISVALLNPSGVAVLTWSNITTASWGPTNYSAAGVAAGAWQWQITQAGGTDGTCDPSNGPSGGNNQMTFSGTATWYQ